MILDIWPIAQAILMFLQSKHLPDVLRTHVFMDRKLMLKKWKLQCKKRPSRFHWNTSLFQSPRVLIVIDEDPVSGKFAEPHDILQLDLQFPSHSPSFHIFHLLSWMGFPTSRSKGPASLRFAQWIPGGLQLAGAESKLCAWRNDSRVWLEWDGAPRLNLKRNPDFWTTFYSWNPSISIHFLVKNHGFLWMFRLFKSMMVELDANKLLGAGLFSW